MLLYQNPNYDKDLALALNKQIADLETELKQLEPDNLPYPMPNYDSQAEKWIDLDGTQTVFLKITYGEQPITEVNFFNITSASDTAFVRASSNCLVGSCPFRF